MDDSSPIFEIQNLYPIPDTYFRLCIILNVMYINIYVYFYLMFVYMLYNITPSLGYINCKFRAAAGPGSRCSAKQPTWINMIRQ